MNSMRFIVLPILVLLVNVLLLSCKQKNTSHEEMKAILSQLRERSFKSKGQFSVQWKLSYMDSLLNLKNSPPDQVLLRKYLKAHILLELGLEEQAISLFEEVIMGANQQPVGNVWKDLAVANLRLGERSNCISNHASASCILPLRGLGVHTDPTGSQKAIEILKNILPCTVMIWRLYGF